MENQEISETYQNYDLDTKLHDIVNSYRKLNSVKLEFIVLNNSYNDFLTKIHENEKRIDSLKEESVSAIEKLYDKIIDMVKEHYLYVILFLIMMPSVLVLPIILMVPQAYLFYKIIKARREKFFNTQVKAYRDSIREQQNRTYETLSELRCDYHKLRKEYEAKKSTLSIEEQEQIDDYIKLVEGYQQFVNFFVINESVEQDNVEECEDIKIRSLQNKEE